MTAVTTATTVTHYVSAGVLWLCLTVRTPELLRHRHDPSLRTLCAVLGLAGLCFFLGAPPTVGAVNDLSGIPNLAAPLTYTAVTAYSAASQMLIVRWRGGARVCRTARRWLVAYASVAAGIAVTFALGDAPVERRTDLDTYYASTPYIREMILLYLLAHLTAVGSTTVAALRWARRVRGGLRAGLTTLGLGTLCGIGFSTTKLAAMAAHWSGRDWSALSGWVSPAAAGAGALLSVTGVMIPLVGPRLAEWRRARHHYVRLEPLERALDGVLARHALRLPRPRWASPVTRLVWRRTSIHNALSHLDAYADRELYEETLRAALRLTGDPRRATATAWATVIAAAARDEAAARGPEPGPAASDWFHGRAPDPAALERIADALATSPLVRAAAAASGSAVGVGAGAGAKAVAAERSSRA
ncbi:MAB_1171c family putative transporter [Streptomyces antibioticus]|uniref:MAB_1171c family putative transporter n=1 Tax=Streptomyces antibioticus TaxID=1890 RepID=UPI003700BDA9